MKEVRRRPAYLFLDIDGMLNSESWARLNPPAALTPPADADSAWHECLLDPACVHRLKRLVDETGVRLVLASTWRQRMPVSEFARLLAMHGFPNAPVVGVTGNEPGLRGAQVEAWLRRNAPGAAFVCVDDDADYLPGQPLVRTRPEHGLTDADVVACGQMLRADQVP